MRLDLFLKASRLIVRRSVAQELCDAGLVSVNNVVAKSSRSVNIGDRISIKRRDGRIEIEIVNIPPAKQSSKAEAAGLYKIMSEMKTDEALF